MSISLDSPLSYSKFSAIVCQIINVAHVTQHEVGPCVSHTQLNSYVLATYLHGNHIFEVRRMCCTNHGKDNLKSHKGQTVR